MRKLSILIFILILMPFIILAQTSTSSTKDNWIVEINGQKYYYSEFINKFNMYIELTVPPDKQQEYKNDKRLLKAFLENFINEIILLNKIKAENFANSYKHVILFQNKQIVVELYIQKVIYPTIPNPTKKEIEQYYNQNSKSFQNIDIEVALKQIEEYLKMIKLQEKINEILQDKKESMIIQRNQDYFEKNLKTTWVLKIGDDVIDYDSFHTLFMEFLNQIPENQREKTKYLLLKQFTESFINTYIMYKDISKNTDFEKKYDDYIQYLSNQKLIELYISIKLKNKFQPVTQDQVDAYYNMNKTQFAGYPEAQAKQYIYQMLSQQVLNMYINDLVQTIRDENIIKRNKEFLQSIGLA
ncbi:MAG: hypothetical protein N3A58_03955 [Spirochaetes bacterium]|nr:hypothetical protein [Spirochaetota bacterium]